MKKIAILSIVSVLASGCAEQSAMRLTNDIVRVNVSTAPIYGALEPERRAMVMAAEETLKSGYDRFIIMDGQSAYKRNVIGVIPGQASSDFVVGPYGGYGSMQARGPQEIAMPRFETSVMVKMFHEGDPHGKNAISAREILRKAAR